MALPPKYDLDWYSIPLSDIDTTVPTGNGVYMIVLNAAARSWTVIYVGKAAQLRSRGRAHLRTWFTDPHEGYWIPTDVEAFLYDPVDVFNNKALEQGLNDRAEVMRRVREKCRFVYSTPDLAGHEHDLENLEFVLQEGVKKHAGIKVSGEIGDSGLRKPPSTDLIISSRFADPPLATAAPKVVEFTASRLQLQ